MIENIAQVIGIIAMAFIILSYQQKKQKFIIAMQLGGAFLFSVHFFMLGAYMGGLLNAVATVRAVIFLQKDKLKADQALWTVGFILVYIVAYVLNFMVFRVEFNLQNAIIEVLPVIGMTATTLAFRCKTAKSTRLFSCISSPSWLIYNITSLSIGAICCEAISIISIIVGLFRYDLKSKDTVESDKQYV